MKGILSLLLLIFSTVSYASTFNCGEVSVNGHPRIKFTSKVKIIQEEVQVTLDKRVLHFSNFNGKHAFSGDKSFSRSEKDGDLFFLVSFWEGSVVESTNKGKPSIEDIIIIDCDLN